MTSDNLLTATLPAESLPVPGWALLTATILMLIWGITFLVFFHRLMHVEFVPKKKPWMIYGYEVPNPNRWLFMRYAMIGIVPALILMLTGYWIFGSAMLLITGCFFHRRNLKVRRENADGLNDPIWGPHIRRNRDVDFDRRMKEFVVRFISAIKARK